MQINPKNVDGVIFHLMQDPSTHSFTKEIIKKGMDKDCVDAYFDALKAVEILGARMVKIMHGVAGTMPHPFNHID